MKAKIIQELLEINRTFYADFGAAFAVTRQRIQPGVRRLLNELPNDRAQDWLDLGCGSGALGLEWLQAGRSGSYCGLDFSLPLLSEARRETLPYATATMQLSYAYADLLNPNWNHAMADGAYDGVMAFASLHHIPGHANHVRLYHQVARMLKIGGLFIVSVWQFQNSAKLSARIQPWSAVGIDETELENGDTLLDWRLSLSQNDGRIGLRYVHLFSDEELLLLAQACGFNLKTSFYSDGAEGNLALYHVLEKQ